MIFKFATMRNRVEDIKTVSKRTESESLDDILEKIGGFGLYQKWIFILTCYPYLLAGFFELNAVFILGVPEHRFQRHNDTNARTKVKCNSWVYDKTVFTSTFVSQENLVCDKKILIANAEMIFYSGMLLGSLLSGVLADRFGRKPVMYSSGIVIMASSIGLPWVTDYWLFCVLQFMTGTSILALFMTGYVISLEMTSPTKRFWPGLVSIYPFSVGLLVLTGIAYGCRDWFYIQLYTSLPCIILITYWWLIPESPRWLLSTGRVDEAEKIIRYAAKWNKAEIPSGGFVDQICITDDISNTSFVHLFTHKTMCKITLLVFFNWFAVAVAYYGLALNSNNLGLNLYLNFGLSGSVEFPAYIVCTYFVERFGRRIPFSLFMIIGGVACISTVFTLKYTSEDLQVLTLVFALIGRFCNTATYSILFIHTAEIFPTVLRNAGLGGGSLFARIGSMTAPYIVTLGRTIDDAFPLIIFGIVSLISGIASFWLPETLNKVLPETIKVVEDFTRMKGTHEDGNRSL